MGPSDDKNTDHTNEERKETEPRLRAKAGVNVELGLKSGQQLVQEWRRRKKKPPAPEL